MRARHSRVSRTLAVSAILVALMVPTACAPRTESTTTVTREPEAGEPSLSARERGALRTEVLKVAKAGWGAFVAMDTDAMREHFSPAMVDEYVEQYANDAKKGRERHRDYAVTFFDVITMSRNGGEVGVLVELADNSYFVEPDGSKTVPSGVQRKVTLELTRAEDGTYQITKISAAREFLK